ncbi:hypothetical protein SELMODRAFT_122132 [Selaginella moellendorffii]|uniref:Uncharacterized protein n=1 Tax=Selaginella moellendorffii TaxID=88036 RepID=D8SPW6_SELML|nr:hypothetical protein SELMODRAFT_122132 [Selaginella moellendorffii]
MGAKSRLQQRDAHAKGRSIIAWDKAGKNLVTAGVDGKVLIHTWDPSVPSAVIATIKAHNAAVTCAALSPNGTVLASGSVDHSVKLYSYPDGKFQSTVTRFTLPIRCLGFSATGGLLAAAGDDDGIKLIAMADNSIARILRGHGSPVTWVAFDPKNEYLTSADSDGTVIFWLISSGKSLHTLTQIAPRIDVEFSESSNCVAWSPDGNLLALPGRKSDVLLLDRDTAEEICTFKGGHTSPVSALAWSLNGKYLATAGSDLQVVLWDVEKQQDIDGMLFETPLCSIAWKPVENALAAINMEGKFSVWESAVPPHMVSPTICVKSSLVSATNFEQLHKFSDDEGSEGHGQSIDLGSQDTAGGNEDNDESNGEEEEEEEFLSSKRRRGGNSASLDDVYDKRPAKRPQVETARASFTLKVPAMQGAFQPGSTYKVEGKRWFLAYNLIGSISSCDKDGSCHVEVEFHDITKGVRIPAMADYFGYTMASLGEIACVLASPQNGDKCPSTLTYRPFNSWASNSEWSMRFPANEEVKAVAVGNGWAAAATSSHFLRIYSEGGVQSFILSLSGPVVSMNGYQHQLVVVTHSSNPLSTDDQAMEFVVLDLQRRSKVMDGRLPLSPGSRLAWIGFSEGGSLGFYDSQGVLRRHFHEFGGCWVPIFRAEKERKNSSEVFWMVGFDETQTFAVICKLPETQPLVFPRPILSFFKHSLPLVNADLGGDDLENDYLRHSLLLSEARAKADRAAGEGLDADHEDDNVLQKEIEHDKYVLRLVAAACKGDKLVRAMELAASLRLRKSLEGAIKVVNAMRLPSLADRLNIMLEVCQKIVFKNGLLTSYPFSAATKYAKESGRRRFRTCACTRFFHLGAYSKSGGFGERACSKSRSARTTTISSPRSSASKTSDPERITGDPEGAASGSGSSTRQSNSFQSTCEDVARSGANLCSTEGKQSFCKITDAKWWSLHIEVVGAGLSQAAPGR